VAEAATCLYISSYHQGYEWNDGIERGLKGKLQGVCQLDYFYLDTKRNTSKAYGEEAALRAKAYIESTHPDILIAADDNASRYLIMPYYRDAEIPVVFCGINYSVEPYGYPYANATGMVEISPVRPLQKLLHLAIGVVHEGAYLGSDVISQHREFELNREIYQASGAEFRGYFVKTMAQWLDVYRQLQRKVDFICYWKQWRLKRLG
jgi:hypothetical protein